ncbi:replicative DNA helicase [Oceanobacillus bengalensis]|uniref:Replicative DNA helicase n=1 Tax=Oceanobacillus bengalensis TaxID=1435466 RepID=A0A494Z3P4_9BACI|nr:replicative DNA helicase [Oceanobacillus bengalensis]RKQ17071.1 replicative DNA helicase [Oceanobacillus bengalensis]
MNLENYEAEASVLGSVLLDGTLFKELEVNAEHFSYMAHKKIFHAMKKASDKGEFIDVVVVTTYLGDDISQVGGTMYLLQMTESVASTASMKQHERLILDAYRLRKARECAIDFINDASEDALNNLVKNVQHYRDLSTSKQEKTTYDYLLEISQDISNPREKAGCLTSYHDFDALTGGLQKGDLIIVAARPSVGKTAFALNLAAGHCKNNGLASLFSLEMGTKQLLHRMISSEGRINGRKWRSNTFSDTDFRNAMRAIGVISNWDIDIYDSKRSLLEIRSAMRRRIHDKPEGNHLVMIDYLQLINPTARRERRDLEVGEITRELKQLAVELNIPIVLLSQLSRGVESRNDKRPLMSDLRESGNIEQDADIISFLYREDYYKKDTLKGNRVEVILSKHRNGPTGTVELQFEKEYGRFVDLG